MGRIKRASLIPLLVALLLINPGVVLAGSQTGTVRFEYGTVFSNGNNPGWTFFYLDKGTSRVGSPGCATYNNGQRWVIYNGWPAAKIQIAILLSASIAGKKVYVQGNDNCDVWGDSETVMDVHLIE